MHSVKVSVIIPIFNTEQYLVQCLDSILNQSLKDIEIICVNDGSTDNSRGLVQSYLQKDSRVKLLEADGKGPGFARNLGVDNSRGEYISFVDSDDYIHQHMLNKLYNSASSCAADISMCSIKSFSSNKSDRFYRCKYGYYFPRSLDRKVFSWTDIKSSIFELRFSSVNKIYRREFLNKNYIRFPVGIFYEDMLFTYKSLLLAEKLRFVRRHLYFNRKERQASTTFSQGARALDAHIAMNQVESFINENPQFHCLRERFDAFKYNKLIQYLPRNGPESIESFYNKLKSYVCQNMLEENSYLKPEQKDKLALIRNQTMLEFIMQDYWKTKVDYNRQKRLANSLFKRALKSLMR